jgi:uncharacterized surface protein with fasciclin (FAS1) repeats
MQLTTLHFSLLVAALPYLAATNAQSSTTADSSSSSLPSDQPSQSSAACPCASNAPPIGGGNFQLQEYLAYLNASGYTAFSSALEHANGSTPSQQWISQLGEGNWTVFAPTNEACEYLSLLSFPSLVDHSSKVAAVPQNVSSNATVLADYLSYHFVHGDLSGPSNSSTSPGPAPVPIGGPGGSGSIPAPSSSAAVRHSRRQDQGQPSPQAPEGQPGSAGPEGQSNLQLLSTIFPNTTIARTTLNASEFVQLEGGRAQVLAWTRYPSAPNVTILNQLYVEFRPSHYSCVLSRILAERPTTRMLPWAMLRIGITSLSPRSTACWYHPDPSLRLWQPSPAPTLSTLSARYNFLIPTGRTSRPSKHSSRWSASPCSLQAPL